MGQSFLTSNGLPCYINLIYNIYREVYLKRETFDYFAFILATTTMIILKQDNNSNNLNNGYDICSASIRSTININIGCTSSMLQYTFF